MFLALTASSISIADEPENDASLQPQARLPLEQLDPPTTYPPPSASHSQVNESDLDSSERRIWREARNQFDNGLWSATLDSLDELIEKRPGFVDARLLRAHCRARMADNKLAQEDLIAVLAIDPRNVTAHELMGELALIRGDTTTAVLSLRLAYEARPDKEKQPERIVAALLLARTLEAEGYLQAALTLYETFVEATTKPDAAMRRHERLREMIDNDRPELQRRIARLYSKLGDGAKARSAWQAIVAERPNDTEAWRHLALEYAGKGDIDQAFDAVTHVLQNGANGHAIQRELDSICEHFSDPAECKKRADELLVEHGNAETILARIDRDGDSAGDLLAAAIRRFPDNLDIKMRAVRLQIDKENWIAAVNELTQVLLKSDDPIGRFESIQPTITSQIATHLLNAVDNREYQTTSPDLKPHLQAMLHLIQGKVDEPMANLQTVIDRHPDDILARTLMAKLLLAKHAWQDCINLVGNSNNEKRLDARLQYFKGKAHVALGQTTEAVGAFEIALSLKPDFGDAAWGIACAIEESERKVFDTEDYEKTLRRLVKTVDPDHDRGRERFIEYLLMRQQVDEAQRVFDGFKVRNRTGPAVSRSDALIKFITTRQVTAHELQSRYIDSLLQIALDYPRDVQTLIEIAKHLRRESKYKRALEYIDRALSINADDLAALAYKAELHARLLDFPKAEATVDRLLEIRPRNAGYLQAKLDYATDRGDVDIAVETLNALIAETESAEIKNRFTQQLIDELNTADRHAQAAEVAKKWLDESPDDFYRRNTYAEALSDAGQHEKSISVARGYYESEPTDEMARMRLLAALQRAEQAMEAIQLTLSWMSDDPTSDDLNIALIRLCWSTQDWNQAIEIAKSATETPNRDFYQELLVQSYRFAGQFDEAIRLRRSELQDVETRMRESRDPRMLNALEQARYQAVYDLVSELMNAERYDEAERYIRSQITELEQRERQAQVINEAYLITLRNLLSEGYRLSGDTNKAIAELELIYDMIPDDEGANNNLGYTLVDNDRDIERAEQMIRKSLAANPAASASLDSLGWVLYKKGEFEEAIYYLRRANRKLEGDDPVILDHLGDAYYHHQDLEQAQRNWKKARDICNPEADPPPPPERRKLFKKIEAKLKAIEDELPVPTANVVMKP